MADIVIDPDRTAERGSDDPPGLGDARRPVRPHGRELRGMAYWPQARTYEGRFGRMFRELDALRLPDAAIADIAARMVEPEGAPPGGGNNPDIPAGYTYVGQFLDHDITFDPASSLEKRNDPDALRNFRTPAFDLDSVYGRGPDDQPYMYDGTGRFLIGRGQGGANEPDLPRNDPPDIVDDVEPFPGSDKARRALIGDPRNDENVLVSQLHLTMLLFHNRVMDHLDGRGPGEPVPELERLRARLARSDWRERFDAAQQVVRWHYQFAVVDDFLRRIVGDDTLDAVLRVERRRGQALRRPVLRHYEPRHQPYMPVEFAVAAYRFGHSMVRNTYRLNTTVPPQGNRLLIFDHDADPDSIERLGHLGGFRQLPAFWPVEWPRFFGITDAAPQQSRLIDTQLATELSRLPANVATGVTALAERNLRRGGTMGLPSGRDVAGAVADVVDERPLGRDELGLGATPAPLWYYVLREAEVRRAGRCLGAVGGRIVAEVFVGLLAHDPSSWLKTRPGWQPFLPAAEEGRFTFPDLIRFTGYGLATIG